MKGNEPCKCIDAKCIWKDSTDGLEEEIGPWGECVCLWCAQVLLTHCWSTWLPDEQVLLTHCWSTWLSGEQVLLNHMAVGNQVCLVVCTWRSVMLTCCYCKESVKAGTMWYLGMVLWRSQAFHPWVISRQKEMQVGRVNASWVECWQTCFCASMRRKSHMGFSKILNRTWIPHSVWVCERESNQFYLIFKPSVTSAYI